MLDTLPNFNTMSLKEMRQLQLELGAAIDEKVEHEMEAAKAKIQAIADELGCEPGHLIDCKTGRAAARKKYGDGDGNTWTGKGRTPNWLQGKLDEGAQLQDFLLD